MSPFQVARRNAERAADQPMQDRARCAWTSNGEQCHYPGSMSRSTLGAGPYYCSAHMFCGDGAEGAQIVQQSRPFRVGDTIKAKPVARVIDGEFVELAQEEPGSGG